MGAKVVAVEPQPRCAREIEARCHTYPNFRVVPKAVGRAVGRCSMSISETEVFSSMDRAWDDPIKAGIAEQIEVEVTTLDALIAEFGAPNFCKIDVEGYEVEVFHGLSRPLPLLSFEFHNLDHPAYLPYAYECLEYLKTLGDLTANVSLGEDMTMLLNEFLPHESFVEYFRTLVLDPNTVYGDIYVRSNSARVD